MKTTLLSLLIFVAGILTASAQTPVRIAVQPIRNMDGNLSLNTHCYKIADSLRNALTLHELNGKQFYIVPSDTIEAVLAEMNLDPNNPQYESDLWNSVAKLNCTYVVTGSFNMNGGRMLLNVYCYDLRTKIADPVNAAKNVFKAPERILDMIMAIRDKLVPGLKAK